MRSPIERLIDAACMKCAKCGARMGTCDCWEECPCGWTTEKGGQCGNPVHHVERLGEEVAANVISHMRMMYKEGMRHASGGFEKTMRATIVREVRRSLADETLDPQRRSPGVG